MSGIIGIIKSWGVIKSAVGLAGKSFKKNADVEKPERTQRDISMKALVFALGAALLVTFVFFWIGVIHNLPQAVVAFFVVVIIAFLFTTVAANAIAIVGSNPVSGMTLMTLIIASGIFVAVGLSGWQGIVASMIIGGVVCTALSMAGGMVTDMKIGYWIGTTPAKQQSWKMLGTVVMMEAMAKGDFGAQSDFEKRITDKVNEAEVGPLGLGGKHSVLATFAKIGPQRASGVRIVALRPCCCFEPRRASVEF